MNLCSGCNEDFASVSGFDAHRVGKHAYTLTEGLAMTPPRDNGRRCLATWELEAKGWKLDSLGRCRTPKDEKAALRLRAVRSRPPSTEPKETPTEDTEAA